MKIKIGSTDYEMKKVSEDVIFDTLSANEEERKNSSIAGCIHNFQTEILINKEYSDQIKKQTFWHEVLHGMLMEIGSDMNGDENFVNALSLQIYGVLKNNNLDRIYQYLEKN